MSSISEAEDVRSRSPDPYATHRRVTDDGNDAEGEDVAMSSSAVAAAANGDPLALSSASLLLATSPSSSSLGDSDAASSSGNNSISDPLSSIALVSSGATSSTSPIALDSVNGITSRSDDDGSTNNANTTATTTTNDTSASSSTAADAESAALGEAPLSSLIEEQAPTTQGRDADARAEEEQGILTFPVAWNNNEDEHLIRLVHLKNIFSAQLPKMPKEYIARLVFDRNHRSVCIVKKKADTGLHKVIGGICFRPFLTQGFAEIVFCAITASEQIKGYGTRLMNHLKEHVKRDGIEYFLTYADNYAVGYFKKQGFTRTHSLDPSRWTGFIKDYDGGTLMGCRISYDVDYLRVQDMLNRQRLAVMENIRRVSRSHVVYRGLDWWDEPNVTPEQAKADPDAALPKAKRHKLTLLDVPGMKEAHLTADQAAQFMARATPQSDLVPKLNQLLKQLRASRDSEFFREPVDTKMVTDYLSVIHEPMDLSLMERKLNEGRYCTREDFERDFNLIITNCRTYNSKETVYVKVADALNVFYLRRYEHILGVEPTTRV